MSVSISAISSMKLQENNWNEWRIYIRGRLMTKGLLSYIDKLSVISNMSEDQQMADQKAHGLIIESISSDQYQWIEDAPTAHAAYKALRAHHEPNSNNARVSLLSEYGSMNWNTKQETLAAYLQRFKTVTRKLHQLNVKEPEDVTVSKLLATMPWSLRGVTLQISVTPAERQSVAATCLLLEEEYKQAIRQGEIKAPSGGGNDERALQALAKARTGQTKCTFCKKLGHNADACRKKTAAKSPSNRQTCSYCKKLGHSEDTCRKKAADKSHFTDAGNVASTSVDTYFLLAHTSDQPSSVTPDFFGLHVSPAAIILDSGASSHMTGSIDNLTDVKPCAKNVMVANGAIVPTTQSGTLTLSTASGNTLVLRDVLHVPGMSATLLSIPTIVSKAPDSTRVSFTGPKCEISLNARIIATGTVSQHGRMYLLDAQIVHSSAALATNDTSLWHQRIGHAPISLLRKCAALNLGVPSSLADTQSSCSACGKFKTHRITVPKTSSRTFSPGECWVSDSKGPFRTESIGGARFYTLYMDAVTRFKIIKFHASLDSATQQANFAEVAAWSQRQTGRPVKIFRSDNGSEYTSTAFNNWLAKRGITHETSTADAQWQNGLAERAHRTIMEMALSMLHHSRMGRRWWAEAINTAVTIINQLPDSTNTTKPPVEAMTGHKPDLSKTKVFGCKCFLLMRKPDSRDKLAPKAYACVFLGYSDSKKAYKLYDLDRRVITHGVHVKFHETEFFSDRTDPDISILQDDEDATQPTPLKVITPSTAASDSQPPAPQAQPSPYRSHDASWNPATSHFRMPPSSRDTPSPAPTTATPSDTPRYPIRFRAPSRKAVESGFRIPQSDSSHDTASLSIDGVEYACMAHTTAPDDPQSRKEAMSGPDRDKWIAAEKAELDSLTAKGTWSIKPLPPGRKPIGTRWVYRRKTDADGNFIRYKARLVCQGFSQVPGIDFTDTFSPVVKMTTLRTVLALVNSLGMLCEQADADNAYVQADLNTPIFARQPPGYDDGSGFALYLLKALYGLRQSGLEWFTHETDKLKILGFKPCPVDPCLFTRSTKEGIEIICVYVDDLLIATHTQAAMDSLFKDLKLHIELKRQGPIHHLLGIKISRNLDQGIITMSQGALAQKTLAKFDLIGCHSKRTPELMGTEDLWHDDKQPSSDEVSYRSIVGSLMYLAICTRPDLAHTVGRLARHVAAPREPHMVGAKRALRYLAGTINLGISFNSKETCLTAYSDASWANKPDRKSTTGWIFSLAGGPTAWKSIRQRIVALSTMESEYIALADASKELLWQHQLLKTLGIPQSKTKMHCDNQSAIATANTVAITERSKHIDVRYHFIRELILNNTMTLLFTRTTDMLADALTKPSNFDAISKFVSALMHSPSASTAIPQSKKSITQKKGEQML